MDFLLFLLLNAFLFIRPGEVIPDVEGASIYEAVILICLALAAFKVLHQLSWPVLMERPITVCVLGLLLAVVLSQLVQQHTWEARHAGFEFLKVVLYYLLLVAVLDRWARLKQFLLVLPLFLVVLTLLAVLQFHGAIDLPSIGVCTQNEVDPETGVVTVLSRIRSTGIFNDPNDLSLILVVGICLCLYWLNSGPQGMSRFVWIVPLLLFGYTLMLTQSRGGLLALFAALLVLFRSRYGWRQTVLLGTLALPPLLLLFAGRQTRFELSSGDTGQDRLQLWSEGLNLLRQNPLFGIGYGEFMEQVGLVAHNSYVHCFTELGLFGGTIFVGMIYVAFMTLHKARPAPGADPELVRLRPFLIALLAGYSTGILTLSRCYVLPTYLILGLVTAYAQTALPSPHHAPVQVSSRLLGRMAAVSAASLVGIYLFVRIFARYG